MPNFTTLISLLHKTNKNKFEKIKFSWNLKERYLVYYLFRARLHLYNGPLTKAQIK